MGYLRLTDFGISREQSDDLAVDAAGTPQYMAPEILFKGNYLKSSDFYSIGAILYELIAQKHLFVGNSRDDVKEAVKAGVPKLVANGWSDESVDLAYKLLEYSPEKRLGYKGIHEVKQHSWFNGFDWNALVEKKVEAPYVPEGTNNYCRPHVEAKFRVKYPPTDGKGHFMGYFYQKTS